MIIHMGDCEAPTVFHYLVPIVPWRVGDYMSAVIFYTSLFALTMFFFTVCRGIYCGRDPTTNPFAELSLITCGLFLRASRKTGLTRQVERASSYAKKTASDSADVSYRVGGESLRYAAKGVTTAASKAKEAVEVAAAKAKDSLETVAASPT